MCLLHVCQSLLAHLQYDTVKCTPSLPQHSTIMDVPPKDPNCCPVNAHLEEPYSAAQPVDPVVLPPPHIVCQCLVRLLALHECLVRSILIKVNQSTMILAK